MIARLAALLLVLLTFSLEGQSRATAVFAGGCFWSMELPFEELPGVLSVTAGYTGGRTKQPTYDEVAAGNSGHYESVQVVYDPSRISYAALLEVFWRNVDPLDADGQFCDRGDSYRTAIFYGNEAERRLAEAAKLRLMQTRRWRVATSILPAATFHRAEGHRQDYARKQPVRYKFYRLNCGRDARLRALWGKP